MSHYGVLVIGSNVEEQLAPYHEFECTGLDDQYVQEIDNTEEARVDYEKDITTKYKDPEGNLHSPYTKEGNADQKFWRELTPKEQIKFPKSFYHDWDSKEHGLKLYSTDWHDGKPYHTKAFAWPSEGWSEVEVPTNTVQTFAEFCEDYYGYKVVPLGTEPNLIEEHKYGYVIVDENGEVVRTVNRTNPGKKWDWYSIGGRWTGFFKLKPLAVGVLGEPGAQTMNADYEPPAENRADVCMKMDVDVEGMRDEAGMEASVRYSMFEAVASTAGASLGAGKPLSWKQVQEKHRTGGTDEDGEPQVDYDAARKEYNGQPMVKALRGNKETMGYELDDYLCTREEYVQRFRNSALTLFAVLKDGKWHERGSMGWWGIVSDKKDRDEWDAQFASLIDGLPDNTLLTVVDCHI